MSSSLNNKNEAKWFVLRDLKRANTKYRAYQLFEEKNLEFFTPMKSKLVVVKGKQVRKEVPCIPDLLFVHETRERLDPIIEENSTVQYRWVRNKYREPMFVSDVEMERFIRAVSAAGIPKYYLPEEITPAMLNRKIRIVGGPLDGYEGTLLTVRGSKVKRLLVDLPGILSVGVEVNPDFIQFV
ncbi:MAG: UpxY family transcription antiterminator [Bacteroides sp.]|nr:UpxY family transcription antiterminator [Bacteroides sp.]